MPEVRSDTWPTHGRRRRARGTSSRGSDRSVVEQRCDGCSESFDVVEPSDASGAVGEERLGVPERGRDHWTSGGQRKGEHPRHALVLTPVRRADQRRDAEQVCEFVDLQESIDEMDPLGQPELIAQRLERPSVALALVSHHLRMGPSGNDVVQVGMTGSQRRHGSQCHFDSLPLGQQTERRHHRYSLRHAEPLATCRHVANVEQFVRRPVRYDHQRIRRGQVLLDQELER